MTENRFLKKCYYIEKEVGQSSLREYLRKHWSRYEDNKFPTNINLSLIKAYLVYNMRKGVVCENNNNKNLKGLKIFFKTRKFREKYFTKKFLTLFREDFIMSTTKKSTIKSPVTKKSSVNKYSITADIINKLKGKIFEKKVTDIIKKAPISISYKDVTDRCRDFRNKGNLYTKYNIKYTPIILNDKTNEKSKSINTKSTKKSSAVKKNHTTTKNKKTTKKKVKK
jgi:hypothetical protein